jgi:hypothetical protein
VIDAVASMWAENRPMSEIAEAIGGSRSAIAGRIDRARRAGDARFAPRPSAPQPGSKVRPKSCKLKPPVSFAALRHGQCRFVVNDAERSAGFRFCAEPVATRGGNYCRKHAGLTRAVGRL